MPAQAQPRLKHFNKYDFVKLYVSAFPATDYKLQAEQEKVAAIIGDAIEETHNVLFEHLATKEDLQATEQKLELAILGVQKDLVVLKKDLIITLSGVIVSALVALPLIAEFVKKIF
jgi:hypothetical protein